LHLDDKSLWQVQHDGQDIQDEDKRRLHTEGAFNGKRLAVGIYGASARREELRTKLWLDHDTVPVDLDHMGEADHAASTKYVSEKFDGYVPRVDLDPVTREVRPRRLVSKEAYREDDPERYKQLEHLAEQFKGKRVFHVSSTPQGGGVALMRQAEIDLLNQMGVDAHWGVMKIDDEFVDVTKRSFHNNFQDVDGAKPLTEERKAKFKSVSKENFAIFKDQFLQSDVVVVDDYQPSGMIPLLLEALEELNKERAARGEDPKVIEILYRSHIQIDTEKTDKEGTPQNEAWNFIWEGGIKYADAFISHPMQQFVPKNVPMERVVKMGAATDIGKNRGFDGLNKDLNEEQMSFHLDIVDLFLAEQGGQTPLDRSRPWVTQIARFDPSKNIEGVIQEYKMARDRMEAEGRKDLPQLVIAGHGAVDDPDGQPLFDKTMELLQSDEYKHLAQDVKVVRLPHIDQPLNAILQGARVLMQRPRKEGFEIKPTEAQRKGVPVIVSDRGGIKLQVVDGVGGYIVSFDDHQLAADHLYNLLTDDALHEKMSKGAKATANSDYGTVQNSINWMYLANRVLKEGRIEDGHFGSVVDLAKKKYIKDVLAEEKKRDAVREQVIYTAPSVNA